MRWYGILVIPAALASVVCWLWLRRIICRDMKAAATGAPLRYGIPHHGMLLLLGIQYLLLIGIWIAEMVITVNLRNEGGALAFALVRVGLNFLLIGCIWLICRIERGYSTQIDVDLADQHDEEIEDEIIANAAH